MFYFFFRIIQGALLKGPLDILSELWISVFSVNFVFVIYKRSLARLSLMIFCWRFFEIYRNFFLLYFFEEARLFERRIFSFGKVWLSSELIAFLFFGEFRFKSKRGSWYRRASLRRHKRTSFRIRGLFYFIEKSRLVSKIFQISVFE